MKKQLLTIAMIIFVMTNYAQDTITGWTFPVNTGADSLNANQGTTQNKGYDLRFQLAIDATTDSTINSIVFQDGPTTYAAATTGWENGAGVRFWSIKFKAADHKNFKLYSKQKSSDGPRDFKIQWRLSSGTYEDVPDGNVTVAEDWTTGVVDNLSVPITDQGTGSIYIRWLQSSDMATNGNPVTPGGWSMIDDILVTAINSLGVDEVVFTNRVKLYPSPNTGSFTVSSTEPLSLLSILSIDGKTIYTQNYPTLQHAVNLNGIAKGVYFLKILFTDNDKTYTQKFVVE